MLHHKLLRLLIAKVQTVGTTRIRVQLYGSTDGDVKQYEGMFSKDWLVHRIF